VGLTIIPEVLVERTIFFFKFHVLGVVYTNSKVMAFEGRLLNGKQGGLDKETLQ